MKWLGILWISIALALGFKLGELHVPILVVESRTIPANVSSVASLKPPHATPQPILPSTSALETPESTFDTPSIESPSSTLSTLPSSQSSPSSFDTPVFEASDTASPSTLPFSDTSDLAPSTLSPDNSLTTSSFDKPPSTSESKGVSTTDELVPGHSSKPVSHTTASTDQASVTGSLTTSSSMTTITNPPAEFETETLKNSDWTSNTWLTTNKDGSQTVLPVFVGCKKCHTEDNPEQDDDIGIILWGVPRIPNAVFSFPGFPPFSFPCFPTISQPCSSPPQYEETNDDELSKSQESTATTTTEKSTQPTSESITSTSTCEQSSTASDCQVICKSISKSNASPTIDCFTTECSRTTSGCSVTGITSTTTQTGCGQPWETAIGRRDSDSCDIGCPKWPTVTIPEIDDLPGEEEGTVSQFKRADYSFSKRALYPRGVAKPVPSFGACVIEHAWPVNRPLKIPEYPGGVKFIRNERAGKLSQDEKNIERWWTTVQSDCMPVVTQVPESSYTASQTNSDIHRASMDHAWEKSLLTRFFASMIDNGAKPLSSHTKGGDGKITCDDFKNYIFGAASTGRGTRNLLVPVYSALASTQNLEFFGMTQLVNDGIKGLIWDYDAKVDNVINSLKDADITTITDAVNTMEKEMDLFGRLRMSVVINNNSKLQSLMKDTNNRILRKMKDMDKKLKNFNPKVKPLTWKGGHFFTREFENFMEDLVNDPDTGIAARIKVSAQNLIDEINIKLPLLQNRVSEMQSDLVLLQRYNTIEAQWKVYEELPSSTWDLHMSWGWTCRAPSRTSRRRQENEARGISDALFPDRLDHMLPNDQFDGDLCELPGDTISTSSSSASSTHSTASDTRSLTTLESRTVRPSLTGSPSTTPQVTTTNEAPTSSSETEVLTSMSRPAEPTRTYYPCYIKGGPRIEYHCQCDTTLDGKQYYTTAPLISDSCTDYTEFPSPIKQTEAPTTTKDPIINEPLTTTTDGTVLVYPSYSVSSTETVALGEPSAVSTPVPTQIDVNNHGSGQCSTTDWLSRQGLGDACDRAIGYFKDDTIYTEFTTRYSRFRKGILTTLTFGQAACIVKFSCDEYGIGMSGKLIKEAREHAKSNDGIRRCGNIYLSNSCMLDIDYCTDCKDHN